MSYNPWPVGSDWWFIVEELNRKAEERRTAARLAAAREALNRVDDSEFYVQCPCCVGRGTLTILLGAKDDEHV